MARRRKSGLDEVATSPWPVGVAAGVSAFLLIRHGIEAWLSATGGPLLGPADGAAGVDRDAGPLGGDGRCMTPAETWTTSRKSRGGNSRCRSANPFADRATRWSRTGWAARTAAST